MEDIVGGDFACDFAEVVEYLTDVLADELCGEVVANGFMGRDEGFVSTLECVVVTHIRYYDTITI